ncbi:hypothetical protein TrST_g2005 [Triparma strigata]|uniref:Glutathione synthetase n=1 Tax=Triparma strigata TaxID=1606541 RepID=A0A9W7BFX6_9STRA|nr:hypothetical protein TrST_g2005 [Triparma strigata]
MSTPLHVLTLQSATTGVLTSPTPDGYALAPQTLTPCPISAEHMQLALKHSKTYNRMMYLAKKKFSTWLKPHLMATSTSDPEFTGKLLSLAEFILSNSPSSYETPVLCVMRSDYMLDTSSNPGPKLVEYNTIASSFGCLSTKLAKVHETLNKTFSLNQNIASNNATDKIVGGLSACCSLDGVIVMVVQPGERNLFDQGVIELEVIKRGRKIVRMSLDQICNDSALDAASNVLTIKINGADVPVECVYFRAGYDPSDYKSSDDWEGRKKLELCTAIKCPDVFGQLFGAKKIQQILTIKEEREKLYEGEEEEYKAQQEGVEDTWVKMWDLKDFGSIVKMVQSAEENTSFVLKPQREGGGNNVYGDDVLGHLKALKEEERDGWVLMETIVAEKFNNTLVKEGKVAYAGVCSAEIGIFGVTCFDSEGSDRIDDEGKQGYICRCKREGVDEGGVAAGFAFLSSIQLV